MNEGEVVRVSGALDVSAVETVRDELLAVLGRTSAAVLDLEEMTELDVAGLQLLCAANRTFAARGVGFEVRGMSPKMLRVAADCGFLRESDLLCSLYEAALAGSGAEELA